MKRWPVVILVLMMFLPAAITAAPTAILVDTSRSVPPKQFEETKEILAGLVPGLLEKGPVAVYAFNDKPVRVVDFSADAAAIRLARCRIGRF